MHEIIDKELIFSASNYHPLPVVIERGEGVYLYDTEGKKYIDMMSAYSAVSHGHCNPKIILALQNQAKKLCVTSRAFHTDNMAPFLEKLCQMSNMDMALPMNTGAEAVETAIKAARQWGYLKKNIPVNKAEIIVAENNFHGRTTTIVGFSSEVDYKANFGPFSAGFTTIPYSNTEALEGAINNNTCAFLVEPMQGEGGIIIPPKGWLKKVQKICKKHNVLLILDEIQTGLGRTGKLFAYQHEIDKPDGLILGKALGGGALPVSAFLSSKEVMKLFKPGSHGSTFGGNPLACAVGMEALNIIEEEKFVEKSHELGKYMMKELKKIESHLIQDIRGSGLWIGVQIDPAYASAREICEKLMEKGILTKDTHETVIRFAPPLIIEKEDINLAVDALDESLDEIEFKKS